MTTMDIMIRPDENMADGVVLCNLETAKMIICMSGIKTEDLTVTRG